MHSPAKQRALPSHRHGWALLLAVAETELSHRDASIHSLNQQVGGLRRDAAEGRQLRLQLSTEAGKCEKLRSQVRALQD